MDKFVAFLAIWKCNVDAPLEPLLKLNNVNDNLPTCALLRRQTTSIGSLSYSSFVGTNFFLGTNFAWDQTLL